MVVKRIISCLAMASVVFLLSCYDVQLDSATDDTWYEDLTEGQIMEGMEIKGSMSESASQKSVKAEDVTVVEKEVEVTWEWPTEYEEPEWQVSYKLDDTGDDKIIYGPGKIYTDTAKSKAGIPSILPDGISEVNVSWNNTGKVALLTICFKIKWTSPQTLLTVQVSMLDSNDVPYLNTVTFLVAPKAMTAVIRPGQSEAAVSSTLYKTQIALLQGLDFLVNPSHTYYLYQCSNAFTLPVYDPENPLNGINWNLDPFKTVFFGISSDFTKMGFGKVNHHSSSSYCKVVKDTTAEGAVTTYKYSFEDLPKSRLRYEPTKKFDYDDVIFYVDLKNN